MPGTRKRQEWVRLGLCETCGRERGEAGTTRYCRAHADERNRKQAERNKRQRRSRRRRSLCLHCEERRVRGSKLCATHKILQRGYEKRYRLKANTSG
jgi:hypothetical protein